jgi:alanyl-tRNA synthetase
MTTSTTDTTTTNTTTTNTVTTFTRFFRERGHERIPPTSLVPPGTGDSVLFTSAGMQPLTRYLLGRPHPLGRRLTGVQRCLRTTDLDEVGDTTHLTLFEMLGSWSLGDYGGPQSLRWGYELLTEGFGLDPGMLHTTVFGGDGEVGPDTESLRTWQQLGLPVEPLTGDNWWSNGPTGPCGPDSEIFVWTGDGPPRGTPGTDERWMELWNHVTMRYYRHDDGSLEPLRQPSVDTGMGLERLLMVTQGKRSVFETDLFEPWLTTLPGLWQLGGRQPSGRQPGDRQPSERQLRLLTDHLRSSIVVIGDGVRPGSNGRGYVLRRLLRRVLTTLWRDDGTRDVGDLPPGLITGTLGHFRQHDGTEQVREVLLSEQRKFRELLTRGRKVLRDYSPPLTPDQVRYLHQTHGLPPDLVTELLAETPAPQLR